MLTLGVRSNIYSACLGFIKYYDAKMRFRDIKYTMLSDEQIKKLTSKKKEVSNDSLIDEFKAYLES